MKGGRISIDRPVNELLENTAVVVDENNIVVRFTAELPVKHRKISGTDAVELLTKRIPTAVRESLMFALVDGDLLADLPGPTTHRILYAAVNDPDERVQANAVEALDRLDMEDRIPHTVPKLESPNGRVRASAVKSLLRAELPQAGEALLDMLEDSSPAHRLSALWVIEGLGSQAVLPRVVDMGRDDPDERVRKRARHVCGVIAPDHTFHPRSSEAPPDKARAFPLGGAT